MDYIIFITMIHNSYNYIHNEKGLKGFALVFSCNKNDEILVEGLLKSFDFCEHYIAYYDDGTNFDYDESQRHLGLIREAEKHGAEWIYLTQPTMRCTNDWAERIEPIVRGRNGILKSKVYYFWDYSLNKIRTDAWSGKKGPSFFRSNKTNQYRNGKLHHIATPTNLPMIDSDLVRYDLRRLGKEVCIAKSLYYENLDGSDHSGLRNFNSLKVERVNPKIIKGLDSNELKYIEQIRRKYCDKTLQSY